MAAPKVTVPPELVDLDPRWEIAINAELDGLGTTDVAAKAGVARKTLWQWRDKEEFQAARRVMQNERRSTLLAKVEAAGGAGLATLVEICKHGENEAARVAAAKVLVERSLGPATQKGEMEHSGKVELTPADLDTARAARLALEAELLALKQARDDEPG